MILGDHGTQISRDQERFKTKQRVKAGQRDVTGRWFITVSAVSWSSQPRGPQDLQEDRNREVTKSRHARKDDIPEMGEGRRPQELWLKKSGASRTKSRKCS